MLVFFLIFQTKDFEVLFIISGFCPEGIYIALISNTDCRQLTKVGGKRVGIEASV